MGVQRRKFLGWAAGFAPAAAHTEESTKAGKDAADASGLFVRGTGEPIARTLGSRAVDEINILDFGAPADGVGDDYPAFCAARDSRPVSEVVRIRMPARTYRLSRTPAENQRKVVVLIDEGATFVGEYRPYGSRVVTGGGSQHNEFIGGHADEHDLVGDAISVHNNGSRSGYGYRFEYISEARNGGGGDIAQASVCQWNKLDQGGAGFHLADQAAVDHAFRLIHQRRVD